MFDKPEDHGPEERARRAHRIGPEDERIAVRCNIRELQLVDSFVASGEFRNRSEIVRAALQNFLRERAAQAIPAARALASPLDLVEVPVRLREEEVETLQAYGELASNGQELADLLAQLVRRGELELKVQETVGRHRASVKGAAEARDRLRALGRTSEELERKGVVGR